MADHGLAPTTAQHEPKHIILRRQAWVASLPLFLFGLCVAAIAVFLLSIGGPTQIETWARGPVWHNGALAVALLALTALIAAAIVALRGRLPVWSYTWIGADLTGLLIALNLVVEDRYFVLSPVVDIVLLVLLAFSTVVTFGAAASRGWAHSGLYTTGVVATLGLSLCFFGIAGPFQTYLGALAMLAGTLEAMLVYIYMRGSNAARLACLAGVGAANVSLAWIVEWVFRSAHLDRGIGPFWSLAALLTVLLIGGTLVGFIGPRLHRALRRR